MNRLHLVTETATFREQAEDSMFLQAVIVALVGAARHGQMDPLLVNDLGDFAMRFGAALRLEPGMRDLVVTQRLRQIAELAIEAATASFDVARANADLANANH